LLKRGGRFPAIRSGKISRHLFCSGGGKELHERACVIDPSKEKSTLRPSASGGEDGTRMFWGRRTELSTNERMNRGRVKGEAK